MGDNVRSVAAWSLAGCLAGAALGGIVGIYRGLEARPMTRFVENLPNGFSLVGVALMADQQMCRASASASVLVGGAAGLFLGCLAAEVLPR
jgi:hypothetical protein